jgi:hypothetical protein
MFNSLIESTFGRVNYFKVLYIEERDIFLISNSESSQISLAVAKVGKASIFICIYLSK